MFTGRGRVPGTRLPSTGSAKCDAYVWLIERLVKAGRVNPHRLGYYIDVPPFGRKRFTDTDPCLATHPVRTTMDWVPIV